MIGRSAQNDSFPWCRTLCDWSACKNEAGFLSFVLLLCGVSEVTTCEDNECVLMSNVFVFYPFVKQCETLEYSLNHTPWLYEGKSIDGRLCGFV